MPTIQVNAQLSQEDLLKAIEQLSTSDLDGFVSRVLALRAHRQALNLPRYEAELLVKINKGLAPDMQARYDALITKRRAECLTPEEYQELLQLTQQVEQFEAQRVKYLAELAQLRQTSLTHLLKELQIPSPRYV
jgi:iron-sulfur cluster repair protein YtfE (RIC family)